MASAADAPAVSVRDLTRRFGNFVAVDRVSFDVARGEIFGFLGPNGSGKSTTIRMLCGILEPSSGSGHVGGFDIRTEQERIKAHIGYMSQRFSLYDDLTVEENIDFYAGIYRVDPARRADRKKWVIDMAGLPRHRDARTATLSGGWKQRLALGCALLHEPSILFLDEPTSGVDPLTRRRFWDLIYELSDQGVTVFVTTHYMEEAEYCDRLGLVHRGALIASGAPAALKGEHLRLEILEVLCQDPQDVMAELEALPGIQNVSLFGSGLHVTTDDPASGREQVLGLLRERGDSGARAERIDPSLEDVFVALVEARDREAGRQAEVAH